MSVPRTEPSVSQCTFVDENGRRCSERKELEFHHDEPYGLGGDHDPHKIRLLCRRHNIYQAQRDYGKAVMDKYRKRGDRVSETAPVYGVHLLQGQRYNALGEPAFTERFRQNGLNGLRNAPKQSAFTQKIDAARERLRRP